MEGYLFTLALLGYQKKIPATHTHTHTQKMGPDHVRAYLVGRAIASPAIGNWGSEMGVNLRG